MEIVVSKKDLVGLLGRVNPLAEARSTMPVLSCTHLEAEGESLSSRATDLYLGARGNVPAEVRKAGSLAVHCKDLLERVRMMPEGPIHLSTSDKEPTTLVLKAVGSARRYTLHGMPGDDFPPEAAPGKEAIELRFDTALVGSLIARTEHAISPDETRAHLNALLFEWDAKVLRMVSTDGHRLALVEAPVPKEAGPLKPGRMLIPRKGVAAVERLCEGGGSLRIVETGATAYFITESLSLSVRLVDATFPPYLQVIPQEPRDRRAKVPRAALSQALRAVELAANGKTGIIALEFLKGVVRVSAESPDAGAALDEVAAEVTGKPLRIGVNAKYLQEAIGVLASDEVELELGGELDPIRVVPPKGDKTDGTVLGIVMPARLT